MNDQNISALPQKPRWLLSEPGTPPRFGTPRPSERAARRAPAEARADDQPGMPRSRLSGYEQILAARASLRAEVERSAVAERRVFAPSPPVPARLKRSAKPPRRRSRLFASGLVAAPVCAALAGLAWIEPAPDPRAVRVAALAPLPAPAAPLPVAAHPDAFASADGIGAEPDREAPGAEIAGRAWDDTAPDVAPVDHAAPDGAEIVVSETADARDFPAVPEEAFAAVDERSTDEAVATPAKDRAAAGDASPAPIEPLPVVHAVADAAPAEPDGSAAPPLPPPPLPKPERRLMALAPPSLAQGDRGSFTNRSPAPPRPARSLDNDAPSAEARCRSIIMKAQLGEEASHVDRTYLRTACRARR